MSSPQCGSMTEVVPCIAEELEVQASRLEQTPGGYDDEDWLELSEIPVSVHSGRDFSLFDFRAVAGPWSNGLDSFDFKSLDGADSSDLKWQQGNLSGGPSSADSCGRSYDFDALDTGLEFCSGKLYGSDHLMEPAGVSNIEVPLDHVDSWGPFESKGCNSKAGWMAVADGFSMDQLDTKFKVPVDNTSIMPAVMMPSFPTVASWGASDTTGLVGSRKHSNGSNLSIGTQLSGDLNQNFCRSPHSGVSTDLSIDVGGSADDDMFYVNGGHPVPAPTTERQKQLALEKAKSSRHQGGSPTARSQGTKRAATTSGSVARKLMSHPEGHACSQCGARSTPVWRAGPLGPKTLCNACGVRYSKLVRKK